MPASLDIVDFIRQAGQNPVIDVRSEGEFRQGHIPGAINIPLFNNEERAKVGTIYKQIGRDKAIQLGYKIADPKKYDFLESVRAILHKSGKGTTQVLVHCWRGGMRSAKFSELLNENGISSVTLKRGYKAFRNYAHELFENVLPPILILGGETGSGKTEVLAKLEELGETIIDLEKLAHHKGSAFGALGQKPQPSTEHFENLLAIELFRITNQPGVKRIWIEDESRNIGIDQIPPAFWKKMKAAPILKLRLDKKVRVKRLVNEYGSFSKEELQQSIMKIYKRLGGQHVKNALECLERGELEKVVDISLTYYDRAYNYHHHERDKKDIIEIPCVDDKPDTNAQRLIDQANAIALQATPKG